MADQMEHLIAIVQQLQIQVQALLVEHAKPGGPTLEVVPAVRNVCGDFPIE